MPYPPFYHRLAAFLRAKQLGAAAPDAADLDAELNAIQTVLAALSHHVRGISSPDGRLANRVVPQAQALVGTWVGLPSGTQLNTTVPWDTGVSISSVLVARSDGRVLRPPEISSVTNSSGTVRVTVSVPLENAPHAVWVFSPGAGIQTRLHSTEENQGASMVGIHDELGLYAATNVEDALAEVRQALAIFNAAVGPLSNYFMRDGSRPATGNFNMASNKITGLAAGTDPSDAVNKGQLDAALALAALDLAGFLLLDGTRAMVGNLNMNTAYKIIGLADADINSDLDGVNVRTLRSFVNSRLNEAGVSMPIGSVIDVVGTLSLPFPQAWLLCDGAEYNKLDFPDLYDVLPASMKTPLTFRVPDLRGRTTLGAGRLAKTPGGTNYYDTTNAPPDEYTSRTHVLGSYLGKEFHRLTVSELAAHKHTVGASVVTPSGPGGQGDSGGFDYVSDTGMTGGDQPHENLPPVFIVNKYIKARQG